MPNCGQTVHPLLLFSCCVFFFFSQSVAGQKKRGVERVAGFWVIAASHAICIYGHPTCEHFFAHVVCMFQLQVPYLSLTTSPTKHVVCHVHLFRGIRSAFAGLQAWHFDLMLQIRGREFRPAPVECPIAFGKMFFFCHVKCREQLQPSKGVSFLFGAFCLDVRTLTFCQLMGFPLNHQKSNF